METDRIDGLALDNDGACLRLMIADHLDWKDEYRHLMALQEKINGYISFCEDGQYQQFYKDATIQYAVFEIHFQHEPTPTALSFLERVQQQLVEMGITIECHLPEKTDESAKQNKTENAAKRPFWKRK